MKGELLSNNFEKGCRYGKLFFNFDWLTPKGEATMTEYEALSLIFRFGSLLVAVIFGLLTTIIAIMKLGRKEK